MKRFYHLGLLITVVILPVSVMGQPAPPAPPPISVGPYTKAACTNSNPVTYNSPTGITVNNAGTDIAAGGIKAILASGPYSAQCTVPQGTIPNVMPNLQVTDGGTLLTGLLIRNLMTDDACSPAGQSISGTQYAHLCIFAGINNQPIAHLIYQYNTAPWILTIGTPIAGDELVTLPITDPKSVNGAASGALYQVCYGKGTTTALDADTSCATPFELKPDQSPANPVSVPLKENDVLYAFKVRGVDASGKILTDGWSKSVSATPTLINSFPEWYNGKPNFAMNCNQGATSLSASALWALLGLILLAIRKRPRAPVLMIAMILFSTSSMARFGQVNFGITGSPYLPNIDGSLTEAGAKIHPLYKCMFNGKLLPLMGLHVDGQMFDDYGTLTLGLAAAYAYASGFGTEYIKNNCSLTRPTAAPAGLHILHVKPQITYILDNWIESFPVAPYIKAAVVGAGYLFTFQGSPDDPRADDIKKGKNTNGKPLGVVFGWEAAAGLMLALDFLQPSVSANARGLGTYDHTYLRFEAAYMSIDNFGAGGLNFSNAWPSPNFPLTLTASLMVEFQ